LVSFIGWAVSQ